MTRMMCLRLLRGVRSGHASVDAMGALVTPLSTTLTECPTACNPGVALWLRVGVRVRPCHGAWWVSASMSNVARMHAMEVRAPPGQPLALSGISVE